MAIQNINRGVTPNDETGDTARAAALKINENFAYLLDQITSGYQGALSISDTPTADGFYTPTEAGTYSNAGGLVYDPEDTDKGYSVHFIKSGIDWTKNRVLLYIAVTGLIESGNLEAVSGDKVYTALSNKADLVVGKNKFDKSKATNGFFITSSNSINANASYGYSDYIPVVVGQEYKSSHNMRFTTYYDSDKVNVSGGANTFITSFTIPANVAFVRITYSVTDIDIFQLEKGITATTYESYLKAIEDNFLPKPKIVNASQIADNIITTQKTNFFENTKNLFNYEDVDLKLGKYVASTNGVLLTRSDSSVTGFIPIIEGQTIFCNANRGGGSYNAQYNSSKAYIQGSAVNTDTVTGVVGCAYVRFTLNVGTLNEIIANEIQIEDGSVGTSYIYFRTLKPNLIPSPESNAAAGDMTLSSKIYLTDEKIDLFFKPLVKKYFLNDRFVRLSTTNATANRTFEKLTTITPTSNGVASFSLYNEDFEIIKLKSVNTVVTPIAKTGNLNTIFIGDSFTNGSAYLDIIKTKCGAGITFSGIKNYNPNGTVIFNEGRGGWTLSSYFSLITTKTNFYNPFYHPSTGRYFGVTGYWKDVLFYNEFDGTNPNAYVQNGHKTKALEIGFETSGYLTTPIIDDLMYDDLLASFVQWDGASWISISQPANWDIDFVKYGAMWNIITPDILFVNLGMNDFRGNSLDPEFTTWNIRIETILTKLKTWSASSKLGMVIPISTLGYDNTGAEFNKRNAYRMWQCRSNIINNFDNREGEGLYIVDNGIGFDEDFGYNLTTDTDYTIPNNLYTGTERLRIQTANPHPNQEGYNLIGNTFIGLIQYLRV